MAISAADVKQLRETTGVGMMDCKKALEQNDGDMDAAVDWLRSRGLAKAAKNADRVAAEGLVGVASNGNRAAVVEINSETDFVARNEQFQTLVRTAAEMALDNGADTATLAEADFPGTGRTLSGEITETIAKIGENMTLRRAETITVSEGVVGTYVHAATADSLGRIGILVGLQSSGDKAVLETLGKQIAMHVAAINPIALSQDDVDPALVERERAVFVDQAKASGKPDNVVEKMVEGRMRKFYEENALLSQTFVIDGENTVEQAIKNAEKDAGAPITLTRFVRFAVGEGVEKQETDFAAEVAAAAGTA